MPKRQGNTGFPSDWHRGEFHGKFSPISTPERRVTQPPRVVAMRARRSFVVVLAVIVVLSTVGAVVLVALPRPKAHSGHGPAITVVRRPLSASLEVALTDAFIVAKTHFAEMLPGDARAVSLPRMVTSDGQFFDRCPARQLQPQGWWCHRYVPPVVHDDTQHRFWTLVTFSIIPALASERALVSFQDGGDAMVATGTDGVHWRAALLDLGVPLCAGNVERRAAIPPAVLADLGLGPCPTP
jgi:hypothetical protein